MSTTTLNGARDDTFIAASAVGLPAVPGFVLGRPTTSAWREQALTKAAELNTLTQWLRRQCPDSAMAGELAAAIAGHLKEARGAAETSQTWRERWRSWGTGLDVERATSNLDAAEAHLLRLAPASYVRSQLPSLQAHVRAHLRPQDPRRARIDAIAKQAQQRDPDEVEQGAIVAAVHAANSEARREVRRLRSFRNVLLTTASLLTLAAIGLGILGLTNPNVIQLCFEPPAGEVCPTGTSASSWDLPLVQLVGMIAAAVAGAVALRGIRGTSSPYSLPVALALLKLPTGALTAVLGLLLMRGAFVPGLSALDDPAQIVAWAVVFGYAQQLFTRLVDQRAHALLDAGGGASGKPRRARDPGP